MPDISMCLNKDCPIKHHCYRFTAVPDKYSQSYSDFKPDEGGDDCEHFLDSKLYSRVYELFL